MGNWPPTPPKNFPLTITDRGYVKRIAGRVRWIVGRVSPKEALKVYHRKAASLLAGKRPVKVVAPVTGAVTLHYILARWIIDRNAVSVLMGHSLGGSRDHYIRVEPERLRKVVEFVRSHLLQTPSAPV